MLVPADVGQLCDKAVLLVATMKGILYVFSGTLAISCKSAKYFLIFQINLRQNFVDHIWPKCMIHTNSVLI